MMIAAQCKKVKRGVMKTGIEGFLDDYISERLLDQTMICALISRDISAW
jgi:hypothetical protein